ncbi:MAG TPA: ChbG/HpnK family deacetylase [Bacillota bacterium]|jgi:hypothetical protein
MFRLIVNADDFGLTPAVVRGIIAAHVDGIVSSTTMMVNMPAAPEAAAIARDHPGLHLGLHLVLTAGRPVLPAKEVPSLVDGEGRFRKGFAPLRQLAKPREVAREWQAQLDRFVDLVGRLPTHLDSHHDVHLAPGLTEVAVDLAKSRGVMAMRVVLPRDLPWQTSLLRFDPTDLVYARYAGRAARVVEASGLAHPGKTLGLLRLREEMTVDKVIGWLRNLRRSPAELITHAGMVDEELRSISSLTDKRPRELAVMCDPRLRAVVGELGIELIGFDGLAGAEGEGR